MELTLDQALQKGVEAHKAGKVQKADQYYTAILKANPKHPDANHNMGVLAVGLGKTMQALPFFKIALEANPNIAQFWYSYIDALIKIKRLKDAKAVLDKARKHGRKEDKFRQLEQRLREANMVQPSDIALIQTLETNQDNTLDVAIKLRESGELDKAIYLLNEELNRVPEDADILALLSHCHLLLDQVREAKFYLNKAKEKDPNNASVGWNNARIKLKEAKLLEALNIARDTSQRFPADIEGMGVLGACLRANGEIVESLNILNRAIELNPDFAEALINRGLIKLSQENKYEALTDLELAHKLKPHIKQIWDAVIGLKMEAQEYSDAIVLLIRMIEIDPENENRLATLALCYQHLKDFDSAIEAYNKVLAIKPDNVAAQTNLGSALKERGKLHEAIGAYKKALGIEPDNAEAYYNMGIALENLGHLEEAIEAYNKALAIKPDYAEAYSNMGNTLKEQGELEEAIGAYKKALTIKPDHAATHRHLSRITEYKSDNAQIAKVEALLEQTDLNCSDRCHLLYTRAKMQEDLGNLRTAFESYVAGGDLRQKSMSYEFTNDEHLFFRIKNIAPMFKDVVVNLPAERIKYIPIFILGMPRSGTTLVEQILSSHSEITGAGELNFLSQFGGELAIDTTAPTVEKIGIFRENYLAELTKRADGKVFITDKMPQNFRFIALICAALPEAKIVHVQRNAKATCWSNFKHYFASENLEYSYNLGDIVKYYGLYKDLMNFWKQIYGDRIYDLNYDKLTEDQALVTRRLIKHLGLSWEDSCLSPEKNKRSVRTASQQQIRQKVYQGSSETWRKYEPYLNGAFDSLPSL